MEFTGNTDEAYMIYKTRENNPLHKCQVSRISSKNDLENLICLSEEEKEYFDKKPDSPFGITRYYLSLIKESGKEDPVRKQCVPCINELNIKNYESEDPLYESEYSPSPGLIHRYKNRALLLLTDNCAVYCRHCFRKNFTGKGNGIISGGNLDRALDYLHNHGEISELLLSGGDPLTIDNSKLNDIFSCIKRTRKDLAVRICTRMPVVLPQRIDRELIKNIEQLETVWIVTQFNHPNEITPESRNAVKMLVKSGIPVLNQTVLLKGVNDRSEILVKLFTDLVLINVKPLYIFQGDLAAGTARFRTNLQKSTYLMKEVYSRLSGIARPFYAVDLPSGGGKIILATDSEYISENGFYILKDNKGKEYFYPEE
jgi:lysine 2,3-aminomutase